MAFFQDKAEDLSSVRLVVVGASAGGGDPIRQVLGELKRPCRWPVVVLQHMAIGGSELFAQQLSKDLGLCVKEVYSAMPIVPGSIYVAPAGYHLFVEHDQTFSLSQDPRVCYSRPSIDVLFESAVQVYGEDVLAILLSGANHDGAEGLAKVRVEGGVTWVQDPEDAPYARMPEEAIAYLEKHFAELSHQVMDAKSMGVLLSLWGTPEAKRKAA